MIVSEKLRLLFIEVPRTATTSMAEVLLGLPGAIRIALRRSAHHTEVLNKAWLEYFTFATVRNPYAREYSVYSLRQEQESKSYHKGTVTAAKTMPFEEYIAWLGRGNGLEFDTPMAEFLRPIRIDRLLHFEDLPGCFEDLYFGKEFNLELPKLHTVINDQWRAVYTEAMADAVWEYAKEDFETFGYERNSWREA